MAVGGHSLHVRGPEASGQGRCISSCCTYSVAKWGSLHVVSCSSSQRTWVVDLTLPCRGLEMWLMSWRLSRGHLMFSEAGLRLSLCTFLFLIILPAFAASRNHLKTFLFLQPYVQRCSFSDARVSECLLGLGSKRRWKFSTCSCGKEAPFLWACSRGIFLHSSNKYGN